MNSHTEKFAESLIVYALVATKKNNGQNNMAIGGIAANWGLGFLPQISPSHGGLCNTLLVGTTPVSLSNDISFRPTALAGRTSVTDGQTDHATVTAVAVGGPPENVRIKRFLHIRTTFIQSLMMSVVVSKFDYTSLIFVDPRVMVT